MRIKTCSTALDTYSLIITTVVAAREMYKSRYGRVVRRVLLMTGRRALHAVSEAVGQPATCAVVHECLKNAGLKFGLSFHTALRPLVAHNPSSYAERRVERDRFITLSFH